MFAYYGESVLAVLFFAILLSFMLSPVVQALEYLHIPRAWRRCSAWCCWLACSMASPPRRTTEAMVFADNVPKYSAENPVHPAASAAAGGEDGEDRRGGKWRGPGPPNVVAVRQVPSWSDLLTHGAGTLTDIFLAASFVPFLTYFLLTWHSHARSATVMLFPLHHRHTAFVTLGLIGKMLQSFIVGNLLIGLLISVASVADFRVAARSVLLFRGISQRLSQPGSVPGNRAGDDSADHGRAGTTGGGRSDDCGDLRGRPASDCAQCPLSRSCWAAACG